MRRRGWTTARLPLALAWRLAAAAAVAVGLLVPAAQPAAAHRTNGRYITTTFSYNESNIYNTIGQAGIDSLYAMDWAWEVEGGTNFANAVACNSCTTSRRVFFTYDTFDGMGGVLARATEPCDHTKACDMYFDLSERWNSTWEIRNWDWMDFRSVALHEFGHWMGAGHSYDTSNVEPDTREPVMIDGNYGGIAYGEIKRSVTQDDIQALRAARNYINIITADDSFEYYGLYHFVERVAGGGGYQFRCGGAGYGGTNCSYRYWGAGSSIYQQVAPRGNYMINRNVRARVRFKNQTANLASATVAVWNMETAPPTLVSQSVCTFAGWQNWTECATPYFQYPEKMFRIEAYNNNGGNMDVDTLIFG
jgi:hypothetical protein